MFDSPQNNQLKVFFSLFKHYTVSSLNNTKMMTKTFKSYVVKKSWKKMYISWYFIVVINTAYAVLYNIFTRFFSKCTLEIVFIMPK